ncbi:nucleotide exchange factor GrpE [Cellulomonas sp. ATA003]|uniref:nucleotide exchange factor GrpE n=1 Tax=Cellulomonas sp. ATA003 TaxID=3073064 RepID=UPI002873AFFF|nr:nucleotide exchange factor GrpE [Cellulomonas sp. ATA003]WNB85794.1 nucleotide exchange factor GrpE [Cellulomonas sp. ATA003]
MTDTPTGAAAPDPTGDPAGEPRFTDKRRIDPETGAVRESAPAGTGGEGAQEASTVQDSSANESSAAGDADPLAGLDFEPSTDDAELIAAQTTAAERLEDLQRLQAEYVNYRKRVDRDRSVARDQAVAGVLEALVPVLDDVELARQHGELEGTPFAAIADKLETTLGRFGWERFGAVGEAFDPQVHEALMHQHSGDVTEPTVSMVMQPGHRVAGRVVRAARVGVTSPDA